MASVERSQHRASLDMLQALSFCLGWAYVVCWGVSLYPPILLNRSMQSVEGVSLDFAYLNLLGCLFYLASVSMFYFSTKVRLEYALRYGTDKIPLIRFNDIVYGAHSLALVIALMWQFFVTDYRKHPSQRLSSTVRWLTLAMLLCTVGLLLHAWEISTTRRHYELVDVASIFGTVKVFLSSIKYLPQAYHNFRRKSVKGFAVKGYVLEVLGGIFCISQFFIDAYLQDDLVGALKHPVKLLLALVSILFAAIFIIQHFLYAEEEPTIYNAKHLD